ncbi:hypothetical protein BK816_03505 [Boudabousia tangfeifanii]|uniref:CobQ/CobB/MinD/ParA nucleotide binding domain-containing protein n=1 Tax=Boudabousia tangfeifanii TaxID=1912795 RepID=A0A1D9MJJ3_9ACTO|nr:ParA family protein [Boudabousia tangfeifanii]AOZ72475.1 hypothetical protein BK816_03505 [Boudabousia tangfeifanii]
MVKRSVLLLLSGAFEVEMVKALNTHPETEVALRCADFIDALAAARSGLGNILLVSDGVEITRQDVYELHGLEIAVIVLSKNEEPDELIEIGVDSVLNAASEENVLDAILSLPLIENEKIEPEYKSDYHYERTANNQVRDDDEELVDLTNSFSNSIQSEEHKKEKQIFDSDSSKLREQEQPRTNSRKIPSRRNLRNKPNQEEANVTKLESSPESSLSQGSAYSSAEIKELPRLMGNHIADNAKDSKADKSVITDTTLVSPEFFHTEKAKQKNSTKNAQVLLATKAQKHEFNRQMQKVGQLKQLPQVIAMRSAMGAPGKTTLAVNLAYLLGKLDYSVLYIDADLLSPCGNLFLGASPSWAGLALACRLASRGRLTEKNFQELLHPMGDNAQFLSGINSAERWPEITVSDLEAVLKTAKQMFDYVVIDTHSQLVYSENQQMMIETDPRDEISSFIMQAADLVITVISADPIGISRGVSLWRGSKFSEELLVFNQVSRERSGKAFQDSILQLLGNELASQKYLIIPESKEVPSALLAARPIYTLTPKAFCLGGIIAILALLTEKENQRQKKARKWFRK